MFRRYRGSARWIRYHSHGSRRGLTCAAATAAGPCGISAELGSGKARFRTKRLSQFAPYVRGETRASAAGEDGPKTSEKNGKKRLPIMARAPYVRKLPRCQAWARCPCHVPRATCHGHLARVCECQSKKDAEAHARAKSFANMPRHLSGGAPRRSAKRMIYL